jgi:palmitoyl-protein thioesterase
MRFVFACAATLVCCLIFNLASINAKPLPVVMWHGMGDTCCNPQSMGYIQDLIQENVTGAYVYSVELGGNEVADQSMGFFANMNDQIQIVCNQLAADPNLKGGFNAIGFSQGSQFLRAYVQRCNNPPVHNLISIGGQHQGVYGLPHCPGVDYSLCEYIRELLDTGVYWSWIQDSLVQAQYWQDPLDQAAYLAGNIFLPDINNALPTKNATYKINLSSLNAFVMVKFTQDSMVQPRESEWFEFYAPGQDKQIIPLRNSTLYKEDWLGLAKLDQAGRLHFLEVDGDHLQFSATWFLDSIVQPYLAN